MQAEIKTRADNHHGAPGQAACSTPAPCSPSLGLLHCPQELAGGHVLHSFSGETPAQLWAVQPRAPYEAQILRHCQAAKPELKPCQGLLSRCLPQQALAHVCSKKEGLLHQPQVMPVSLLPRAYSACCHGHHQAGDGAGELLCWQDAA